MPAQIGLKLRESVKAHGVATARQVFREALASGKVRKEDISLREMAEHMIGPSWADHLKAATFEGGRLRESVDAVDASGFSAITGQLLVDTVMEKYKLATMVGDKLFTTVKISNGNLGTYREPYLSDTIDDPAAVNQGEPYPRTSFVGQYVDYPAPSKFGRICAVNFEMIYSDLTGQALDSAASVGRRVGLWVEKQKLRVASGAANPHSWNGTTYNTFLTSGAWVNSLTDFTLTSWESLQRIEMLFAQMVDPVLNEPIDIEGYQLLTVPRLRYTAKRILNATMVRHGTQTTADGPVTESDNPLEGYSEVMVSKHLRKSLISDLGLTAARADTLVLAGDFKRAFVWREVFPVQVVQAPPQSPEEFNQDIVVQVKANVFGVACVRNPRYVVRAYNASA